MSEDSINDIKQVLIDGNSAVQPCLNNNKMELLYETAEEAATTDSEEYLSEPLRQQYSRYQYSSSSNNSTTTLTPNGLNNMDNDNIFTQRLSEIAISNFEIPIVGYEVMEERARFTVFKLRIENKAAGGSWFVFRRYTDFVRLCNKLKHLYPHVVQYLPNKRWLGNNFDPVFLEERTCGLQTLVNAILREIQLVNSQEIKDFFCLDEPPVVSETDLESRALFEAQEDTIYQLQSQLKEKEARMDVLQDSLHSITLENENLKKIIKNSTMNCQKCRKDFENISKTFHISVTTSACDNSNGNNSAICQTIS